MDDLYPCYAIQVKSRYEMTTAALLRLKGYDPFIPTYHVRRRWSDRYVSLEAPLIPGYVFCRFDVKYRLPLLCTEGVQGIVGAGKSPISIDEAEMEYLRMVVESGLPVTPCPFQVGQTVRLDKGPLAGVEGIIVNFKKQQKLVVSICLLQRSVCVEVNQDWVELIRHEPAQYWSRSAAG
jgi:transcription antitermination factor NusG